MMEYSSSPAKTKNGDVATIQSTSKSLKCFVCTLGRKDHLIIYPPVFPLKALHFRDVVANYLAVNDSQKDQISPTVLTFGSLLFDFI